MLGEGDDDDNTVLAWTLVCIILCLSSVVCHMCTSIYLPMNLQDTPCFYIFLYLHRNHMSLREPPCFYICTHPCSCVHSHVVSIYIFILIYTYEFA